jgi:hypothetical protein
MKSGNLDLKPLRLHLVLLVLIITLWSAVLFVLEEQLSAAELATRSATMRLVQASDRLSQVQAEEREIRQYLEQYRQWDARLAFTEFNRAWVADQADMVLRGFGDAVIQYKIAARTEFAGPETQGHADYQLFYYPIEIRGRLLHEARFLPLYEKLNRAWYGPVNWERCELKRQSNSVARALPFIEFDCRLKWLQLQNAPASVPAASPGVPAQ